MPFSHSTFFLPTNLINVIINLMNKDEKRVEYLIAHKNNLWAGVIIVLSGTIGLLLSFPFSAKTHGIADLIKVILFFAGLFLFALMMTGVTNVNLEIKNKLK